MIEAIIIDDERSGIETLLWELNTHCPEVKVVAECTSAAEGLAAIKNHGPDVVFLDIEMPQMNGFEMLRQIEMPAFDIIVTTAYDRYAIKAFKASAIDYLLKPVSKDELIIAVQKVIQKRKDQSAIQQKMAVLFRNLQNPYIPFSNIVLPSTDGLEFIAVSDIIHCRSESNYTHIFLSGKQSILVSKTLKEIEQMLSGHPFFRVHHSHLVSLQHIKKYVKGEGGYVIMDDGTSVNVSRSRKKAFLEYLHMMRWYILLFL